jgi:hypothetical protein
MKPSVSFEVENIPPATQITFRNTTYRIVPAQKQYVSSQGSIFELEGCTVQSIERSFHIWSQLFHKVQISVKPQEEIDYQLKEGMTYIIDHHWQFITLPSRYKPQKVTDIMGKISVFWNNYYISVTHAWQTYILNQKLQIQKDALGREIRNIFKIVRIDGKEFLFCEVFEYGKWITNTVLKRNFTPFTNVYGKEIISIQKYDISEGKIVFTAIDEDGKSSVIAL